MSWVFPGLPDVLASCLRPVSILIKDDLPTFDLPIKANSGNDDFGQSDTLALLITKDALLTRMITNYFRLANLKEYC
jgi:hypothetical protein